VVMNRAGRVLCIEQKNGRLEEVQGQLFKHYGDNRKSVGCQTALKTDHPTASNNDHLWSMVNG